jgi:transcriptional regulator with XRE-family HTH domain
VSWASSFASLATHSRTSSGTLVEDLGKTGNPLALAKAGQAPQIEIEREGQSGLVLYVLFIDSTDDPLTGNGLAHPVLAEQGEERGVRARCAMLSNEELAERIRQRRHSLGLTQEALAERAGVSRETIGRLEQAATGSPTLDTLCKVAKALGTTGPFLISQDLGDEVAALIQGLPEREREIACVMLRALSAHVHASVVTGLGDQSSRGDAERLRDPVDEFEVGIELAGKDGL